MHLVTCRHTGRGLLLWCGGRCVLSGLLPLLDPPFLACLEDIARYAFAEFLVAWAAMLRKGESGTVDIRVDVVVPYLVLGPIAAYVICNVGP